MDDHRVRVQQSKQSKKHRKSRQQENLPTSLRKNLPISNERQSGSISGRSSTRGDPSRLNKIINYMTSEGEEARGSVFSRSREELVEPDSPVPNENGSIPFPSPTSHSAAEPRRNDQRTKRSRFQKKSGRSRSGSQQSENIGELRRKQLTDCFETFQTYWESAQNTNIMSSNDNFQNEDSKNLYQKSLWYDLKCYFHGYCLTEENTSDIQQNWIEKQRERCKDEFLRELCSFDKIQSTFHNETKPEAIQRRHLSESHIYHCEQIEESLKSLFHKWDELTSLFPSQKCLEKFQTIFNPKTKEGRRLYEKLSVFQAWLNLNSEINCLIDVLGRLMGCSNTPLWPTVSSSAYSRSDDSHTSIGSRPSTPSINVSNCSKMSNSTSVSGTSDMNYRRNYTISSSQSVDGLNNVGHSSSLTDYYSRYLNDQLIHGRVVLMTTIFRSKHGRLMQRLRYIFRKEQTSIINSTTSKAPVNFDTLFKYYSLSLFDSVPQNYLSDAKEHRLMDEFLLLNKQLHDHRNPNPGNTKKSSATAKLSKVNNILGRFEQNPTLKSNIFAPASAPTLILRMRAGDRSSIDRQSYFLDYLDPTLFPHLPGSTLFPDPCTFLENLPFNSCSQTNSDEMALIGKMLHICVSLYEKEIWTETEKFSDMFEIFGLPSLYPQYVFLAQIPLDLMLAWQKYHQDRKMEQPSTKGALLLLIDECKILIHSSTLIRQYVKLMTIDVFDKPELKLIEQESVQFDQCIGSTLNEVISYVERYVEMSVRSNAFHDCMTMLKEQWKSLKQYAAIMNLEELLGEKFLHMVANVIRHFHDYINVFHNLPNQTEWNQIVTIKNRIRKRYQKKLTTDILREVKTIYDDCALTINIYLQRPVCRRFLLILKKAGFERIKFEHNRHSSLSDRKDSSTCLLFAPAEYFEDNMTKLQLIRTLSSSFRLDSNESITNETNDELLTQGSQPFSLLASPQAPTAPAIEQSPPLVYVLCVPVSREVESEWRGVTHTIPVNKYSSSMSPLNENWKTTTIFLMTHQTNNLEDFEKSFRERLSTTNVQQNDLYDFDPKLGRSLQKRSCFEKVDESMNNLAHLVINLNECVVNNIEQFEKMIEKLDTEKKSLQDDANLNQFNSENYSHTEELAFCFGMDLIRETSYYATQHDLTVLKSQVERQMSFAQIWLHYIGTKKTLSVSSKQQGVLPMWLLSGVNFLRYICSLNFTIHADDKILHAFQDKVHSTLGDLYYPQRSPSKRPPVMARLGSTPKPVPDTTKPKKKPLTRIQAIDRLEKEIDRRRYAIDLIGCVKKNDEAPRKLPVISKKMEQDLASIKILDFHKLNLLARGKYAITYKCTVNGNEVLCYKQYKIQHNDAQAINNVLNQLLPLIHIKHENLTRYRGIALEYDHILFFMEYCSHGTIAQVLLGTTPSRPETNRHSSSVVCSLADTSDVENGIIQTTAGYAFFQEFLARQYLKQLLSALSCLHKNEIIHRDIRNVNIFFRDANRQSIKLGDVNFVYDFKFMKKQVSLLDMEAVSSMRESVVFCAPETITQNETTIKSDIWSLGCALVHMLTGRIPWCNSLIASSAYYLKIANWVANGAQPSIPSDLSLSENCKDFLRQCFRHDPNLRPSSDTLLQHPFIKDDP